MRTSSPLWDPNTAFAHRQFEWYASRLISFPADLMNRETVIKARVLAAIQALAHLRSEVVRYFGDDD